MKPKMVLKLVVDMIMTILLFLLMAYLLVGETVHEWMGLAMFILFIFHHALNWNGIEICSEENIRRCEFGRQY